MVDANLYNDNIANIHILGSIINDPMILEDTSTYKLSVNDFTSRLHKIIFSAVNNLFVKGMQEITALDIKNYLQSSGNAEHNVVFDREKGIEFIEESKRIASEGKLDYYYHKSKKLRFLRELAGIGYDVRRIYDPKNLNFEEKQQQEQWLEDASIEDLVERVTDDIDIIANEFALTGAEVSEQAGSGVFDLLAELDETPAIGYPTYDPLLTRVMQGMRLGKYSLMSAPSGVGKTRQMVAMFVAMGASHMYDQNTREWKPLPTRVPALFIATEQDLSEIQTLMLANIAKVNEEHILNPEMYLPGERERVMKAAEIIENSPLYVTLLPDFGISDIENAIKSAIKEHGIHAAFFDYINTSIKILSELSNQVSIKMREDQVLFLLSTRLKELAVKYGISIMSATQTNRASDGTSEASSAMLKGASAIVEKADFGAIMMRPTEKDKEMVKTLGAKAGVNPNKVPNMIFSIYKNRRSKFTNGKLWVYADLGTCTFESLFFTDHDYQLQELEAYEIVYEE